MIKVADETLQQVRKKLSDIKMQIQFCSSLRKLRAIRKQHAIDKNILAKNEDKSEQAFENSIKELETVILNQKSIYENEKNCLMCKYTMRVSKFFNF